MPNVDSGKVEALQTTLSVLSYICDAFIRKEQVFLDLERAYDMTWKHGIFKDLYQINFGGCLPILIKSFLLNRLFRVKVANTLNDSKITLFCKFIYMLSWTRINQDLGWTNWL